MTNANRDQIEFWNSDESRHWVEHQWRYDSMLEPYVRRLLSAAEIGPAERVLDIGCGTGTTTLAAAVGARDVLGVDIAEPMIARARDRAREKRGGGIVFTAIDGNHIGPGTNTNIDAIALDEALERLAAMDPQQSRIVELRFFGGLTIEETADALDISPATVKREWTWAKAWLFQQLGGQ